MQKFPGIPLQAHGHFGCGQCVPSMWVWEQAGLESLRASDDMERGVCGWNREAVWGVLDLCQEGVCPVEWQ